MIAVMMILHLILSAIPLSHCDEFFDLDDSCDPHPATQVYIQNPSNGGDLVVLVAAILLGAALIAAAIVYGNRKPR